MWRTSQGNRCLKDGEATAFKAALGGLVEDLAEWGEEHQTGVGPFDVLSYGQRIAVLEDLAAALFDPAVPMPSHTAANEAAVFVVFQQLKGLIEVELDDPDGTGVRMMVRTACLECGLETPSEQEDDPEAWDAAVDALSDQVLWDHDFADGDDFLDVPPDDDVDRKMLGITAEYYSAVPRELRDEDVPAVITRLRAFTA